MSSRPAPPARADRRPPGLERFNEATTADATARLLSCCASPEWAYRVAAHRPYPDLDALLAAADEAGYDLLPGALSEALAAESAPGPGPGAPAAAHTALSAAHAAYESRFGHVFVICLDAYDPADHLDQLLSGIRARLTNEPEDERVLAAEELRRLARGRLARAVLGPGAVGAGPGTAPTAPTGSGSPDSGRPGSPYVPV